VLVRRSESTPNTFRPSFDLELRTDASSIRLLRQTSTSSRQLPTLDHQVRSFGRQSDLRKQDQRRTSHRVAQQLVSSQRSEPRLLFEAELTRRERLSLLPLPSGRLPTSATSRNPERMLLELTEPSSSLDLLESERLPPLTSSLWLVDTLLSS